MKVVQLDHEIIDYGVKLINPLKEWSEGCSGEGIKVAVLDTGIDYNHVDLKPNFKGGINFTSSNSTDLMDIAGHGTFCAGIIGGAANDVGIIGVAPKCDLYAVKVLNNRSQGTLNWLLSGIEWCIRNDIDIVNLSLGFNRDYNQLHDVVVNAYNKGITLVAAVGNNKFDPDAEYPARYREVIGTSAIDSMKQAAHFANRGKSLELVGPGVNITSCYPLNRYAMGSGTSFACPHIVGAIALIQSKYKKEHGRKMTNEELRAFLIENCIDLGIPGKDFIYGYGLFSFDK